MPLSAAEICISARDYNLEATLTSGQAFRWSFQSGAWEGIVGTHWIRLEQGSDSIHAESAGQIGNWQWLQKYLQTDIDLKPIIHSFPDDEPMRASIRACRGLRLLRQDPWECLASFILSSTKQIVQIQQIVALICERYGNPVEVPPGHKPEWSFPTAERLAQTTEAELRACKMGFRAPNLLAASRMIARKELQLESLPRLPLREARQELLKLPGVGHKIADCVLLFACGFQEAFPVDVWIMKALRQLYFPKRRPKPAALRRFTETHFGPHAGYAQQYLFHYMRKKLVL